MKVFKITDTEGFFETLSECRGEVQIVGNNGTSVSLGMGSDQSDMKFLRSTGIIGTIKNIELKFQDSSDAVKMMGFMMTMNHAA